MITSKTNPMKTIINYMKNWRILTLGIFMNLSLILLICESDVFFVFFMTKLVGILAGYGTIAIAEKWHKAGKIDILNDDDYE